MEKILKKNSLTKYLGTQVNIWTTTRIFIDSVQRLNFFNIEVWYKPLVHSFYFLIALVVFEGSLALGTGDRIPTSLSFEMQYTAHPPFPDNIDEMSGYCARLLADKQKTRSTI
jgi:hypothetical protein